LQDEYESKRDKDKPFAHDDESKGDFFERVYDELHGLAARQMRSQPPGHTLQATALVSELYLKLGHHGLERWKSRDHFISMAAAAMRSILVDHARSKSRQKRRPQGGRIALDEAAAEYEERSGDLVALDEALMELGSNEPDLVSLVELRFFGGCSMQECARLLGKSLRTVQRDWRFTKDWLRKHLDPEPPPARREAI
jgi:RNA polymerase sigma factor (TIGR02999 family)